MLRIYTYAKCSTCKSATRWLTEKGIVFKEVAIRENPPSVSELNRMFGFQKSLKKLFNTSGLDYRSLGLSKTFDTLSKNEAFKLLASNGNLVKRPFLVSEKVLLIGFNEKIWKDAFAD
jgi:arsenate reductase